MSHAEFLRDHWPESTETVVSLVQTLDRAAREAARLPLVHGLALVQEAIRGLEGLETGDREVLLWVSRSVLAPRTLKREYLAPLRQAGFSDVELHDLAHLCACFSYMNRLADMLGVTLLEKRFAWARTLFGEERLEEHLAWGTP